MNKKNWIIATLEEITEVNPTLDKTLFPDDLMVSFVPMPAVEAGTGKIDVNNTRRFCDVKKGYTTFQKDDVLFAKITPCMENGKIAVVPVVANQIGFGSTEFHVLRPRADIDPSFVYYFISSQKFRYDAEHNMTGAVGQRRVPAQYLKTHSIPVPPFKEQKRIVAKIEELFSEIDKGVENLQKVQELLIAYHKSLLKSAATGELLVSFDLIKNVFDDSYKTNLSKIVSEYGQGWSPKCLNESSTNENDWAVIKTTAIQTLEFLENENKLLPINLKPKLHLEVMPDDILVTRAGPRNRVGIACLVKKCRKRLILCDKAYRIRVNPDIVLPAYLEMLLNSPHIVDEVESLKTGINDSGVNLTQDRFLALELIIPPLPLQQLTLQKLQEVMSAANHLNLQINIALEKLTNIRQSILKKAFAGELVSQDSYEEPVNVLLERIKEEKKVQIPSKKQSKQLQKVVI